jgi:hypothetical protein
MSEERSLVCSENGGEMIEAGRRVAIGHITCPVTAPVPMKRTAATVVICI